MAKAGRLPDFRKMYPEASEEIISVLKETERKMQYQEYDLKAEQAEYYGSNVPLFRRNGYRQSGVMIP